MKNLLVNQARAGQGEEDCNFLFFERSLDAAQIILHREALLDSIHERAIPERHLVNRPICPEAHLLIISESASVIGADGCIDERDAALFGGGQGRGEELGTDAGDLRAQASKGSDVGPPLSVGFRKGSGTEILQCQARPVRRGMSVRTCR